MLLLRDVRLEWLMMELQQVIINQTEFALIWSQIYIYIYIYIYNNLYLQYMH